jgi:hypothetical protein
LKPRTRATSIVCLAAYAFAILLPSPLAAQATPDDTSKAVVQSKFEQVVAFRLDGEYDRAISALNELISKYARSDEILRRAYNHLVTVYVQNNDEAGARGAARMALQRFPDLTADELDFPGAVNRVYDQMRKEMFGAFVISQPEECRVYLDSTYVGDTPLRLDLVRVGEYDLTVTKSGYKDYASRIEIQPELTRDLSGLSLERDRAWWWWPAWIGGAAVAAVGLAIGLGGSDEEPEEEPLPAPPGPPPD